MGMREEVAAGIAMLRERIEHAGRLKIVQSNRLSDRLAQYFAVGLLVITPSPSSCDSIRLLLSVRIRPVLG